MSAAEKLIKRFKLLPNDFHWSELARLLSYFGYIEMKTGKTGGSRVKFFNPLTKDIISLHRPHPSPVLKRYQMKQIHGQLIEHGLIARG